MATNYLLSGLSGYASAIDLGGFKARYPFSWIVWEAGQWQPPAASTVQMDKETFQKMLQAGETMALGMEEKPRPGGMVQLTLGRGADCDLTISDGTVSDRHLVFTKEAAGWNVRDAGSRNGTQVNGQALPAGKPLLLKGGEHLQVGQVKLTYYTPDLMFVRARMAKK
jgi:hypothetical protein